MIYLFLYMTTFYMTSTLNKKKINALFSFKRYFIERRFEEIQVFLLTRLPRRRYKNLDLIERRNCAILPPPEDLDVEFRISSTHRHADIKNNLKWVTRNTPRTPRSEILLLAPKPYINHNEALMNTSSHSTS